MTRARSTSAATGNSSGRNSDSTRGASRPEAPAPVPPRASAPLSGSLCRTSGPGAGRARFRSEWWLPALFALLALLVLVPNLFLLDAEQLYPVRSDSAKYDAAAVGVANLVDELPSALPKLFRGGFTPEERDRYDWGSGILQHATSYVVPVGIAYAWFGHHEKAGRLVTVLFVALTAGLLVLWTQSRFGRLSAVLAGLAFVFWPAHLRFGTAIMTEMPMAFWVLFPIVVMERTRKSTAALIVLGGALLGVGMLVKISLRYLLLPLLLVDFLERGGPGRFRFLALRLAGVLAVVALWGGFLRGADLPADGIAAGFESQLFLFRGNYPEDRGFESVGLGDVSVPELLEAVRENPETAFPDLDERMVRVYRDALGKAIRNEPSRWAALVAAKAGWFWRWPAIATDVQAWFGTVPPPSHLQLLAVAAGWVGLGLMLARGGGGFLPLLLCAYLTALHAGSHLVSRYNVPAVALFLPYAGFGLSSALEALRGFLLRLRGAKSPDAGSGSLHPVPRTAESAVIGSFWRGASRWERLSIVACAITVGVRLALPRDLWVGLGLDANPAHAAQEATTFAVFAFFGLWLLLNRHRCGVGWPRSLTIGMLPVIWGLALLGDAHADRDPDVWGARLSRPGDRIVQTLALPDDIQWRAVRRSELFVDMMEDAGSHPEVIVRLNGDEVRHYREGLGNPDEDYLLDRAVYAVQERYKRVDKAYDDALDGYVLRRYPDADKSYFRQWFRIPVQLDSLRARGEMVIEIELVDPDGGGVTVFGDGQVETAEGGANTRTVHAPAFLENPYELSTYQFLFFLPDRIRADVRFIRPLKLHSPSATGEFFRQGRSLSDDLSPARGRQRGEYRIRFRTALHGRYVGRTSGDRTVSTWAVWPSAGEVPVGPDGLRVLSARRDSYFTGWRSY